MSEDGSKFKRTLSVTQTEAIPDYDLRREEDVAEITSDYNEILYDKKNTNIKL